MNTEERKIFWELLCSFTGNDVEKERATLEKTIKVPDYIYRYRKVSVSTIDSLQRNRVFFSNAEYYDDPFDTLLHIDFDRLRNEGRVFFSSGKIKHQIQNMAALLGLDINSFDHFFIDDHTADYEKVVDLAISILKLNIQGLLREKLWTACFTEDGDNENMWLKYGDQYKGFCLIYDLHDLSKDLCGTQEKCVNCVVNNAGTALYPVFYSDDGYDATEYAKSLFSIIMLKIFSENYRLPVGNVERIMSIIPNPIWQIERVSLIKSKCHEYDKEWRLLLQGESNTNVMKEWIPNGVILGLKMTNHDKEIVIRSSKQAGINHIFESYINDKYRLDHRELIV